MSSSSRQRPSSQLPKAPTSLSPNCVIADTAVLTGAHLITIAANVVIHPRARINSTWGPVTIGEGCIISERAIVGLPDPAGAGNGPDGEPASASVMLENDVVLEPAAVMEGQRIGQGSTLEAGGRVCTGSVVGKYCKVAPLCTVAPGEVLDDFTVVFGNNQWRREKPGLESYRKITHDMELEVLRRLIPSSRAKWQTEST